MRRTICRPNMYNLIVTQMTERFKPTAGFEDARIAQKFLSSEDGQHL